MHRLVLFLAGTTTLFAWDRQKAFDYLEARQQKWAEWKPAQKAGGACVSCHTGLSYLMAQRLAGPDRSPASRDLVQGVKTRIAANPPQVMLASEGAEAILSLLTLSFERHDRQSPLPAADEAALKRLWEKQIPDGDAKGSWSWFMHDLHPVESEHSHFFAATLADLALSKYPANTTSNAAAMQSYLQREFAAQPLHNKLAWAAFSGNKDGRKNAAGKTDKAAKAAVLANLWSAQASDGGFTSAALGPWAKHQNAPPDEGSNAYATAWAAFAARQAGADCQRSGLRRALEWLKRNQDPATGAWNAVSMNKVYPAGSMQEKFMTDAATGYAAAALVACRVD